MNEQLSNPQDTPQPGERILAGRYRIGEFIGQGGMSTVYRGVDTKLGRQVAIKVMKANLSGDEHFRSRFRKEAQAASRMAHPTIVRVLDAGDDLVQTSEGPQELPFIVMEYVDGTNLRTLLSQNRLSRAEACRVVEAVLTALEYSHRAGIVHRDIKPANIMISKSGQVKVMDFGIARAVSETSSTLQQTTAILGTAAYFSPEQAKGEQIDARTDLYSTAVLLYELLTGDVPFKGDTAVAVAYQHVSERPQPPSKRDPSITPELERVVLYGLAKDRARRFQTAAEFRDALRQAAAGEMPQLDIPDDNTNVLFSPAAETEDSDFAIQRLQEGGVSRPQHRPPVLWIWTAIVSIAAVVIAVAFWLLTLAPKDIVPDTSRKLPDLSGMTQSQVLKKLSALELKATFVEETDDEVPAGHVSATDPVAGSTLSRGEQVIVYMSTGREKVAVPSFAGKTLSQYKADLEAVGLSAGVIKSKNDGHNPKDTVLDVIPGDGEHISKGSTVTVTVASGRMEVPNVVNQPLDVAEKQIDGSGFAIEIKTLSPKDSGCEVKDQNPIVKQSVTGEADQGSKVELYYCFGF